MLARPVPRWNTYRTPVDGRLPGLGRDPARPRGARAVRGQRRRGWRCARCSACARSRRCGRPCADRQDAARRSLTARTDRRSGSAHARVRSGSAARRGPGGRQCANTMRCGASCRPACSTGWPVPTTRRCGGGAGRAAPRLPLPHRPRRVRRADRRADDAPRSRSRASAARRTGRSTTRSTAPPRRSGTVGARRGAARPRRRRRRPRPTTASGDTYDYYWTTFQRDSIDGAGPDAARLRALRAGLSQRVLGRPRGCSSATATARC